MTLMFTHKASGAWDALTTGLIEAGFVITASWPLNTEAEGSLHIKDKGRRRTARSFWSAARGHAQAAAAGNRYWEDVEPLVRRAVRERMEEFQQAGIAGVDLYLASFGPALEEFSRRWPLKRGTPRARPERGAAGCVGGAMGGIRGDAGRRAGRRPARGQEEAAGAVDASQADADLDPATAFFRVGLGRFQGADFFLRRGFAAGSRGGRGSRRRGGRPLGGEEGRQLADVGQRLAGGEGGAGAAGRLAGHDRRRTSRGARGAGALAGRGARSVGQDGGGSRAAFSPRWRRCWRCCRFPGLSPAWRCKATRRDRAAISRRCGSSSAWPTATASTNRSS